jgi:hypothetical protein
MFAWVFYLLSYVEQPSLDVISLRESGAPQRRLHGVAVIPPVSSLVHSILLIPTVLCRKLHAIAPCPLRHQHTYWQSNNKSAGSLGSIFFTFLSLYLTFSLLISFTYSIKSTGSSYNGFQS